MQFLHFPLPAPTWWSSTAISQTATENMTTVATTTREATTITEAATATTTTTTEATTTETIAATIEDSGIALFPLD